MQDTKLLWDLKASESAEVKVIESKLEPAVKIRLTEMGFEQGQKVSCTRRSPFNGPMVIQLAGTALAIEKPIAEKIYITLCN
jgi:ferrous iron transport protein A